MHADVGAYAATCADVVVGVGPLARSIVDGVGDVVDAVHAATIEDAVAALATRTPRGSTVWLKGSRAIGLERIVAPLSTLWEGT
jgi:UDP-N-acetylmuramyl pentapeptide synthase